MRIITDPSARAIALENGEVHMSGFESQARLINRLKKVDHLTTTSEGYGAIGPLDWLAMNTTRGPTADVRVRQAIAYEADKNLSSRRSCKALPSKLALPSTQTARFIIAIFKPMHWMWTRQTPCLMRPVFPKTMMEPALD